MKSAARVALVVCAACVWLLSGATVAVAAGMAGGPWSKPVNGPVVRAFDPPETRFGPGHLGVDFGIAPGTPVRAAGAGVVVFAGRVGDGLHVVVRHAGDLRTSYSFLASVDVVNGQPIERGATVGTSGGTGAGHSPGVLHFGVRVGATYVDPMLLFEPVDLAAVVHLAAPHHGAAAGPVDAAAEVAERSAIAAAVRVDARPPVPPPQWWGAARAEPSSRPRASPGRSPAPRSAARKPVPTATTPAAPVALAIGGTVLAVFGATRKRSARRISGR